MAWPNCFAGIAEASDISKQQQIQCWGQNADAGRKIDLRRLDVLYLHRLRDVLNGCWEREGRMETGAVLL